MMGMKTLLNGWAAPMLRGDLYLWVVVGVRRCVVVGCWCLAARSLAFARRSGSFIPSHTRTLQHLFDAAVQLYEILSQHLWSA